MLRVYEVGTERQLTAALLSAVLVAAELIALVFMYS
jgi:hypothetical protein